MSRPDGDPAATLRSAPACGRWSRVRGVHLPPRRLRAEVRPVARRTFEALLERHPAERVAADRVCVLEKLRARIERQRDHLSRARSSATCSNPGRMRFLGRRRGSALHPAPPPEDRDPEDPEGESGERDALPASSTSPPRTPSTRSRTRSPPTSISRRRALQTDWAEFIPAMQGCFVRHLRPEVADKRGRSVIASVRGQAVDTGSHPAFPRATPCGAMPSGVKFTGHRKPTTPDRDLTALA